MIQRSLAVRLGAPLLIAATVAAACSSSKSSTSTTPGGSATTSGPAATTATTAPPLSATLNGSGSTFQKAYDDEATAAFKKVQPGVTINYGGGGSGKGRTDLQNQIVDFAGTDAPAKAADLPSYKGGAVLYFPTVAGPITISYKLSGVSALKLSGPTIAKIFSRSIKSWDDAAITADNGGTKLPAKPITVVHRSDASGTTQNFTTYLTKAGGADWTLGSGQTVSWPSDEQAGNANSGVAQIVSSTDGAVGYVDFSDAKAAGLSFADVKNAAGKFVTPSTAGASAALAGATVNADLTYDPINPAGDAAYPITSPTYLMIYAKQSDTAKGNALKAFLAFVLSANGQAAAKNVDFAALSADLDAKAVAQLDKITIG